MKLQILSLFLMLSIVGCSQQTQPSLDIQIYEAYAGETNAYLKGSIFFSGLDNADFSQGHSKIRFRYFYIEDQDGVPWTTQFQDGKFSAPMVENTYIKEINETYPQGVNTQKISGIMVLASIYESNKSDEILRVWCEKKINWKKQTPNQELQPTVTTPVESGNQQGTAAEL